MTLTNDMNPRPGPLMRFARAIPLIGRMIREIEADGNNIYYALFILLTLLILAVKAWGLVALALSALAMVPVMFALLIVISVG